MASTPGLLGPDFPLALDLPFTAEAARAAGITRHHLTHLHRQGFVRRLLRGVYVAAQTEDSQLLRATAIKLVVPDRAVVTDESAAWLAGARMVLPPGSHLEVPPVTVFISERGKRLRNQLCSSGTRDLEATDVVEMHGVRMTTPLRTALDLGRLRRRDHALACLDQLLALGAFTQDDLVRATTRFAGFRGVRQLRVLAPLADPRSESPGESALRLRFHDAGLPDPVPQFEVVQDGQFLGRADLALPELRFIAEYDGEEWHGPERQAHDLRRRSLMRESGWTVVVLRRANVYGHRQDAVALLQSGVREARRSLGIGRGETRRA